MMSAAMCCKFNKPQASFGRHFSHACHTSVRQIADVGIVTSAFSIVIRSILVRIRKYYIRLQDALMLRTREFRII